MINLSHLKKPKNAGLVFLVAAASITGCSLKVDPYTDELSRLSVITTPSLLAARAMATNHTTVQRTSPLTQIHAANGTVTHAPLYFEDKAETNGSVDGQFAWTAEDYHYILIGPARFIVNILTLPFHAVITPPGTVMASDVTQTLRAPGNIASKQNTHALVAKTRLAGDRS